MPPKRPTGSRGIPETHTATHDAADDPRNAGVLIFLDARIVPRAEAVVSVYDSGFLLGDEAWEGVRLKNGRWAFLEAHLDRLFQAETD